MPCSCLIWILELSHGVFNHSTGTDQLSCRTIRSLKQSNSWHISQFVNKVHFTDIWCEQLLHPYLFIGRCWGCHHLLVRIRNLSAQYLEAIWRCICLSVQRAALSANMTNQVWRWLKHGYAPVWQQVDRTKPNMTTSWSRSPWQHLQYSLDNIKHSISSPNDFTAGAGVFLTIGCWTTAGALNSGVPHF
jgi:hypothetical protein